MTDEALHELVGDYKRGKPKDIQCWKLTFGQKIGHFEKNKGASKLQVATKQPEKRGSDE